MLLNLVQMVKKTPQSYPWIGSAVGGLIGLIVLIISPFNSYYLILNTVAFATIIGCVCGWILGENIDGVIVGGIVGSLIGLLIGLHLKVLCAIVFGGAFGFAYLMIFVMVDDRGWGVYLLFCSIISIIMGSLSVVVFGIIDDQPVPPSDGFALVMAFATVGLIPILNTLMGFMFGGMIGYFVGELIDSIGWMTAPLFVVPLFAFTGYGISKVISISEIKKEEWRRKQEEQRLREEEEMRRREEQRRKEQERNEIKTLIDETEIIIETAIHDATKAKDSLWLSAIKILQIDILNFSQEFESGGISYMGAKGCILDLKEQAEVLSTPPSKFEKVEEESTYYDILGVTPYASQDEIKKARNEKVKKLHPEVTARWAKTDKVPQEVKEFLHEMSQKINEAYEVLSDPDKRREYDKTLGL